MRTDYLRHLAIIIDIQWSRPVGGGGGNSQLNWLACCKRQKCSDLVTFRLQTNMMQYSRKSMGKLYYNKSTFFVKIIPTISILYVYHKYDISDIL